MRGDGACGIVGAVSGQSMFSQMSQRFGLIIFIFNFVGVKNPVQLAQTLLSEQCKGLLSLGRIPPMYGNRKENQIIYYVRCFACIRCMCGHGARSWARSHGIDVCEPDELISG